MYHQPNRQPNPGGNAQQYRHGRNTGRHAPGRTARRTARRNARRTARWEAQNAHLQPLPTVISPLFRDTSAPENLQKIRPLLLESAIAVSPSQPEDALLKLENMENMQPHIFSEARFATPHEPFEPPCDDCTSENNQHQQPPFPVVDPTVSQNLPELPYESPTRENMRSAQLSLLLQERHMTVSHDWGGLFCDDVASMALSHVWVRPSDVVRSSRVWINGHSVYPSLDHHVFDVHSYFFHTHIPWPLIEKTPITVVVDVVKHILLVAERELAQLELLNCVNLVKRAFLLLPLADDAYRDFYLRYPS